MSTVRVMLHGGAGRALKDPSRKPALRERLRQVTEVLVTALNEGQNAIEVVALGCRLLEDDPNFNAGTGSAIQSDGQIRMSASLMDGDSMRFSGIINVQRVEHPIDMAAYLQGDADRVIAAEGAQALARELGLPIHDPSTPRRLKEWVQERDTGFASDTADVVAEDVDEHRTGTVGVVALDLSGKIAAGTSTGGRGFERIGRVSDSATAAGNYATSTAGISVTGVGEDIVDEGFAVRVIVRTEDGLSLKDAMRKSIDEAVQRSRMLGAIAVDRRGKLVWGKTSPVMLAAWYNGNEIQDALDAGDEPQVECVGS